MIKIAKHQFILLLILLSTISASHSEIAFVDVDYLFEKSNLGIKIKENLNQIKTKDKNFLKSKEKELIAEEKDLKNAKNVLSENEFNNKAFYIKI